MVNGEMGKRKEGSGKRKRKIKETGSASVRFPFFVLIHVFELFVAEIAGDHFVRFKLAFQ